MKTPVEELFEKLWNTDKDKFAWNGIFSEMSKKKNEPKKIIVDPAKVIKTSPKMIREN